MNPETLKVFGEAGIGGLALAVFLWIALKIIERLRIESVPKKFIAGLLRLCLVLAAVVAIVGMVTWGVVTVKNAAMAEIHDIGSAAEFQELPAEMQSAPSTSDGPALADALHKKGSLKLHGTKMTLPPGAERSFTIAADTIYLSDGATVITNGNDLDVIANRIVSTGGSKIASFLPDNLKSVGTTQEGKGNPGQTGGRVTLWVTNAVEGTTRVYLPGQEGAVGSAGATGAQGAKGERGANAVQGMWPNCSSGGQDGKPGAAGNPGGPGRAGGDGGSGGNLILRGKAAVEKSAFIFSAPGGKGGAGGAGGVGGPGGPGGDGAIGGGNCKVGNTDIRGPARGAGPKGADGTDAKDGSESASD